MVNLSLAKRIGSIIILSGFCFAGELELSVLSLQGRPIKSVGVNSPFLVRVSVPGASYLPKGIDIEGMLNLVIQHSSEGSHLRQIARSIFQEVSLTHTVVADQVGLLTIGPATLNGEKSEIRTIEVVEGQGEEDGYPKPEVTFTLDKEEAYVGEKVSFTLTFIWQDPDVSLPSFEPPYTRDLRVANFRRARQFKETHEGKDRYIVECKGDMYPLEPGQITIDPLKVTYRINSYERDMFSMLFSRPQIRAVRSESVQLMVKPLPKTDKKVQAVGVFTEFAAALSSDTAPQHEAVSLVLYLSGETDFTQLKIPTLNIPDELRSYESKTVPRNESISWVYILQGLEEGTSTIPQQEFVYFDTVSHSYKVLTTNLLVFKVTPGKPQPAVVAPVIQEEPEPPVAPVKREWFSLQLWLFVVLMILPPFIVGCLLLYEFLYPYVRRYLLKRRAKSALSRAKKELETVSDYTEVYPLVKKALAEYYEMPHASEKMLIAQLSKQGLSEHFIEQVVGIFYDANRASHFSQGGGDSSLIKRAKDMLTQLSKVLVVLLVCLPLQASEALDSATSLLGGVPFIVWQLSVLIGWWLLWLLYKRLSSETYFLLVFIWCMFVGGWALRSRVEYRPRAWVLQKTEIYVGPGKEYPVRAALEANEELILVKKKGSWYYVNSTYGIGWVQADSVEKRRE